MRLIHNSLMFKLRSDLATNSNDMDSLGIEIINKKKAKMLSLVHSIDKQPVVLNNIKRILKISLIKWKILITQFI